MLVEVHSRTRPRMTIATNAPEANVRTPMEAPLMIPGIGGRSSTVSLEAVSVIVYLWGITETEEQREAVRVAAENVVETGKVRIYLNTLPEILRGIG